MEKQRQSLTDIYQPISTGERISAYEKTLRDSGFKCVRAYSGISSIGNAVMDVETIIGEGGQAIAVDFGDPDIELGKRVWMKLED